MCEELIRLTVTCITTHLIELLHSKSEILRTSKTASSLHPAHDLSGYGYIIKRTLALAVY